MHPGSSLLQSRYFILRIHGIYYLVLITKYQKDANPENNRNVLNIFRHKKCGFIVYKNVMDLYTINVYNMHPACCAKEKQ